MRLLSIIINYGVIIMMSSRIPSWGSGHKSIFICLHFLEIFFKKICIFLKKLKKWHMCKQIIRRGPSMPVPLTSSSICCSYHEIKGESWHHFYPPPDEVGAGGIGVASDVRPAGRPSVRPASAFRFRSRAW